MPSKIASRCIILLLTGLVGLLVGCGAPDDPEPTVFRYQLISAPSTLDPALAGDTTSGGVIDRLFDGLMKLDRSTDQPVWDLAESHVVSDDRLVYSFQLKPEVIFHNGRPIQASDYQESWQRLLAPESDSPKAWLFELIEGAEAFQAGTADTVSGIEVEDPYVLRIRLVRPFAPFLYHLAAPEAGVVPIEEVRRLGEDFERQPVGSGPFRFGSWEQDRVVLDAFTRHQRRPQVEQLIYRFADAEEGLRLYQAGDLDLVTVIPTGKKAALRQSFSADLRVFPGTLWSGFCFRCDQEPFTDVRIRRAIALAIDRNTLVQKLDTQRYTASTGFIPQGIPGHQPSTLTRGFDLVKAKQLWLDAEAADLQELSFAFYPGPQVADALEDGLRAMGIKLIRDPMPANRLFEGIRDGILPLFRQSWGGEYPDPEPYLRPLFHSRGPNNRMAYSNPEVDRLLDAAQSEPDAAQRLELYRQAETLITEDAPCVGLYQLSEAVLLRPGWQGIPVGFNENYFEIELARWAGGSR